jgi:hypothetical protein
MERLAEFRPHLAARCGTERPRACPTSTCSCSATIPNPPRSADRPRRRLHAAHRHRLPRRAGGSPEPQQHEPELGEPVGCTCWSTITTTCGRAEAGCQGPHAARRPGGGARLAGGRRR